MYRGFHLKVHRLQCSSDCCVVPGWEMHVTRLPPPIKHLLSLLTFLCDHLPSGVVCLVAVVDGQSLCCIPGVAASTEQLLFLLVYVLSVSDAVCQGCGVPGGCG
jgi:hypothetical protein